MKKNVMADILRHNGEPGLKLTLFAVMTLAMPAIVEQVMITMVQYIDTAMVGSLGSQATAAVGLTASTTWLFNGFLNAAAVGFSVQVAQYVGAGNLEEARGVLRQSIKFIAIFGLLLAGIAFGISSMLPIWLGADRTVAPLATAYFMIIGCAMPFNFCVMMLSAIIRCAGDTKTPMLLNLMINLINVVLNFLFIYPTREVRLFGAVFTLWGADLGVAGAALGSAVSLMIVSGLFLLVVYKKQSPIQITLRGSYRFDSKCLLAVVRLGVPVALERSLLCVAQIVITGVISAIGTVAIAANHLAVTAESLSYLPAYGVATAGTTLVGQAVGAGRKDLAMKFSRIVTWIGVGMMTVGGALLFFFASNLIMIFSSDPHVIALGTDVLRIVAFAEPFFAMSIVITGGLRGAGDTKGPFLICLITMWGVRITLSLLLVGSFGLKGVWIAMAVELFVRGVLFLYRMESKKWLKIKLFDESSIQTIHK